MPSGECSTRRTWPRMQDFCPMRLVASAKEEHSPVDSGVLGRSARAVDENNSHNMARKIVNRKIRARRAFPHPDMPASRMRLGPVLLGRFHFQYIIESIEIVEQPDGCR